MDEIDKFLSKTTKKKSHIIFYKNKHTKIKQNDIKMVINLRTTKCAYNLPLTINNPKKISDIKEEDIKNINKKTINKKTINKNTENKNNVNYKNHLNLKIKKSLLNYNLKKLWHKETIKPSKEKTSNIKKEEEFKIPIFTKENLQQFSDKLKENFINKKKIRFKNFFDDIKNIKKIYINKKLNLCNTKLKNVKQSNLNSLLIVDKKLIKSNNQKYNLLIKNSNLKIINKKVNELNKKFYTKIENKNDKIKFNYKNYVKALLL